MFLLGYYALVTAGMFVGSKVLSACIPDEDSKPKERDNRAHYDGSSSDSYYEPFATSSSEWAVYL